MFSELIDQAVSISGRADKRAVFIGHANATIRECQTRIGKVSIVFFRDLIETSLTPTTNPYVWEFPRVGVEMFRILRTVFYPNANVYPRNRPPGRIVEGVDHYYYAGPTYVTFAGVSAETAIIIAYYRYLPSLTYYADGARPAVFDLVTQTWSYLQAGSYVDTLGSDTLNEAAQALSSNWLLDNWFELILSGTLAKAMLVLDDPRGSKYYSLYNELRQALAAGEQYESLDF